MKNTMLNMIKYLLKNYPDKSQLSASRLINMMYLAEWKNLIEHEKQLTNTIWQLNKFGPYINNFLKLVSEDKDILVKETENMFHHKKRQIKLSESFNKKIDVSVENKEILDFVIKATKDKKYNDVNKLVSSTYPVLNSNYYSDFNLAKMANDYKEITASASLKSNSTLSVK